MSNIIELRPRTHGLFGTLRYCGTGPVAAPKECQWLSGDGPWDESHKCGAPAVHGQAWCERHSSKVFKKVEAPVCSDSPEAPWQGANVG